MGWICMGNYKLPREINEAIVDGIMVGYKSYLAERKRANKKLRVSGGYAWVRGNHIDHYVAEYSEPLGLKAKISRAGTTWRYLQFIDKDEHSLFLVRNGMYFDKDNVTKGRNALGETQNKKSLYMDELTKINHGIAFEKINQQMNNPSYKQLTIFEEKGNQQISIEDLSSYTEKYNRFYIVTYTIDKNHLISKINLWLPNPHNDKAYLIDDLTGLIGTEQFHHPEDRQEILSILESEEEEQQTFDAVHYGIMLPGEEKSDE